MERASGVLLPMSALPSPYGIGSMGKSAYAFVDFLEAAGQRYWQLLPLGPTNQGDSPYSSFSTFAGNPCFIDLDLLIADGLLEAKDLEGEDWGKDPQQVDYDRVRASRQRLLRLAFSRGREKTRAAAAAFRRENASWLEGYALYMALKAHFDGAPWTEWPEEIRCRRPEAMARYGELLREEIDFQVFVQYLFYSQWDALRRYAQERGLRFFGDIPIYVALDSADVWSEPQFFQLDENNMPGEVAGVPPDAFSDEGQFWGNPLYDWDAMRADGYGWWIRRIDGARKLYDMVRIDHFRAFESYWAVPGGETTAKNGRWRPGPGMGLVGVLTSWFCDLDFVAEDLGIITDDVRRLLKDSGLPGMKVLQFAFDAAADSDYLPHNCQANSVCYVGTHDNNTVLGWVESSSEEDLAFARRYMHITDDEGWCWGMIRTGMATASRLFMVQMQELLELPGACRTNIPGTAEGNWRWRMLPGAANGALAERLRRCTETYRRL